ncbi:hypothetical protein PsorP6_008053 [Peronosclerospora sorghi]|uniref:Uncharacterized protein n=1 Tax=Peronosclerospora sorghi TaxID=230839 RepID=A0ACC0W7M9_9STRA|nr:hypothetical protein PsorP6_008053 [Peronosclerospora sorghi]
MNIKEERRFELHFLDRITFVIVPVVKDSCITGGFTTMVQSEATVLLKGSHDDSHAPATNYKTSSNSGRSLIFRQSSSGLSISTVPTRNLGLPVVPGDTLIRCNGALLPSDIRTVAGWKEFILPADAVVFG